MTDSLGYWQGSVALDTIINDKTFNSLTSLLGTLLFG